MCKIRIYRTYIIMYCINKCVYLHLSSKAGADEVIFDTPINHFNAYDIIVISTWNMSFMYIMRL